MSRARRRRGCCGISVKRYGTAGSLAGAERMLEEDCKMKWVLFVVLASTSGSEKAINSTAVPMATEQLCNAAKEKLTQAYRKTQTPNYLLVTECLQAR